MDFQIYKIDKCGFYNHKGDFNFGNINLWWTQFTEWAKTHVFEETRTYYEKKSLTPSVYCSTVGRLQNENNRYGFISLWNETPSRKGVVQSMPRRATVNQAEVKNNSIGEDTIPGWASNFIVDFDKKYIIAVTPNNGFTGRSLGFTQLDKYFYNYLFLHSDYCVWNDDGDTKKVIGYCQDADCDKSQILRLVPKFKTKKLTIPSEEKFFIDNFENITKIVYRTKMDYQLTMQNDASKNNGNVVIRLMEGIGIPVGSSTLPTKQGYTFYSEIQWKPSKKDLQKIIDKERKNEEEFGVKFSGDTTVYWLNRAFAKCEVLDDELPEFKTVLDEKDFTKIWGICRESILSKYPK